MKTRVTNCLGLFRSALVLLRDVPCPMKCSLWQIGMARCSKLKLRT